MPSTATNETSASPIIRAAAVEAVRDGLRTTFSLASRPATPPRRRDGIPTIAASPVTSRDATPAMPRTVRSVPSPSASRFPPEPIEPVSVAFASSARPTASTTAPTIGPSRFRRGSTAPSRTAAIGATRVARNAGARPASSVTPTPTTSATTNVRSAYTGSDCGSSSPSAAKISVRPFANPMPTAMPTAEATTPIAAASRRTERSTCRRDAPSVRSVASSRTRCAIVIDSVLKMTNAPTKSAMPPKASRKPRMKAMKVSIPFLSSAACSSAVRTSALAGTASRSAATSVASETPSFAATDSVV